MLRAELCCLLLLGSAPLLASPPPAAPPPACEAAEHRQFDFWLGDWEVFGGPQFDQLLGRNRIEKVSGGCALAEHWVNSAGRDGHSLNVYEPARKQWTQFWIGSDGVVLRLIGKWLNAGVMEDGELSYPESGTPQGGVISPILANVYLHVVLDMWFEREVKPKLGGKAKLVRFADDFVIAFEQENDARRVYEVLPKRFAKFGLELHPEKTRLVPFKRPPRSKGDDGRRGVAQEAFDLLGFTLFWAKSERGCWVIKAETAPSRFTRTLHRLSEWCRKHRHFPVVEQWKRLCKSLAGHFNYFGVVGNAGRLLALRHELYGIWRRWLDRRSQRARMSWAKMRLLHQRYPLPKLPEMRPLRS